MADEMPQIRESQRIVSSDLDMDESRILGGHGDFEVPDAVDPEQDPAGYNRTEVERLASWLQLQATCSEIMRQRGGQVLADLLLLAARLCKHHKVRMPPRIASVARFHGIHP